MLKGYWQVPLTQQAREISAFVTSVQTNFTFLLNKFVSGGVLLGPLCYKLITIVNCFLETGLSCIVY